MTTALLALALIVVGCTAAHCRESGGMYTLERLENVLFNVERYDWARQARDGAVSRAKIWAEMSDENLWRMIPGQDLPRCIDVGMNRVEGRQVRLGCIGCGEEIFKHGNYPYRPDVFGKPWKLTCPSCGLVTPTNDFGAYYESGIDERGVFNPARADRALLFNAEHPDPDDPLHRWGVDDGFGYVDEDGMRHKFIGYYVWQYWGMIRSGVNQLADAYLYTGDPLYARKCAIMLDRIADVYPDMDWAPYAEMGFYHSDGGSRRGKIEGRIWETGVLRGFAESYDKIIAGLEEQPELYELLREKGEQFTLPLPKGSREALLANIDESILRCGAEAIRTRQIWGNEGMHQSAMAACAIALDTEPDTSAMLDWIFTPDGGGVPGTIVGKIDRDGVGDEAGPGYALGWGANIGRLADMLADYGKYENNCIYRDFPQFRKTFTAGARLTILDYTTPNIGDAGSAGSIGKVAASPAFIVRGYRYLRDPDIGLTAYRLNGNSAAGLGRSILDADPEWIERELEDLARERGAPGPLGPHNMPGYGLLTLEYGEGRAGTGIAMYYGRNGGHGHLDRLNLHIYGFGFDLAPDLGYPEFATSWPHRNEWGNSTISHNTVLVDEAQQAVNWVGHPSFFKVLPGFQAAEVDSREVYPATREYRRTVALINAGGFLSYGVDIFRVAGGDDHLRSFHGTGVEVTTTGLDLAPQETGTYAGPDIPFGTSLPRGPRYGYSWLGRVERDGNPPPAWIVDWKVQAGYRGATEEDDIHLRLWDFTPLDEVALADGEPPKNKPGNPRWIRYLLAQRAGTDLTSTFVSLLEPWRDAPLIASARRLDIPGADPHDGPVALMVSLTDGATDYIVYSPTGEMVQVAEGFSFAGRLGFVRVRDEAVERAALIAGTRLEFGETVLQAAQEQYSGAIARMTRDPREESRVWVDAPLPTDETLVGQEMIIENDRARNACYTIRRVERDGNLTMVSFGDVSLVRGHADRNDYAKGFVYNFEEGARFVVPNHAYLGPPGE